jgi:chaperone required for assembly of F1-ATPase
VRRPNGEQGSAKTPGQRGALPRRFYQTVTIARIDPSVAPSQQQPAGYRVLLDGKELRTPAKGRFAVPAHALAAAIAAEWQAQREHIDLESMPLTRLTNAAIDGVTGRQAEVGADIVKYLGSDLVCYRAADPSELVRRQAEAWDPVLDWCQRVLGIKLTVTTGIVPVAQPAAAGAALAKWLHGLDAFALAAAHAMTTLLGSAVLTVAHAEGRLACAEAWAAAHIDEDFQAEKWGVDSVAKARRDRQWCQMQAASWLFTVSGGLDETLTISR